MGIAYTLGRILIPLVFIVSGIQKFLNIGDIAKMLASTGIPIPDQIGPYLGGIPKYEMLGYIIAALEIVCGLMVLIGLKARWAALVLIVFSACNIFFVHHFWDGMSGQDLIMHRTEALKYLSIMGGLLLVVSLGSGPSAMDRH